MTARWPQGAAGRAEASDATPIRLGLVALGLTSIASQVILLREFLAVLTANELIIGLVLASWMLLTAGGALMARRTPRPVDASRLSRLLVALALLPPLTVAALRLLRNQVFTVGGMIGLGQALASTLLLLAPYCLLAGGAFASLAAALADQRQAQPVAAAYAWESLGSALGGVATSLLLLPWLDTFQALGVVCGLDLGLAIVVAQGPCRSRDRTLAAVALLGLGLATAAGHADRLTRAALFPGQEILAIRDTPYGNLTVTRQGDQRNVFANTTLLGSTNEVAAAEESVHYAMAQRPGRQRVLLLGGGTFGATAEILKYPGATVDYAEANPWLLQIGRSFGPLRDDPRLRVINDDARRFVRHGATTTYDTALLALPDPETAELNRLFTVEFLTELKKRLAPQAVLAISLLPAAEYQGPEARLLASSLAVTLRKLFANLLIVPGNRNFFLASDGALRLDIGRLIEERGVTTTYVNRFYLDETMLAARSRELFAHLDPTAPVNSDWSPVCYQQQLRYWLTSLGTAPGLWIGLMLAAVIVATAWRGSAVGTAIMTTGFTASALEIILLLALQTICGSLYRMTGLLVAAFMAGLAVGAWLASRWPRRAGYARFLTLQLLLAATGLGLPLVLAQMADADLAFTTSHLLFTALAFLFAALIGMTFAVAAEVRPGPAGAVAGELYGLDLAGSALGALVVSVYAIPLLGLATVSRLTSVVTLLGAGSCWWRR